MKYILLCLVFLVIPSQSSYADSLSLVLQFGRSSKEQRIAERFADEVAAGTDSLEIETFGEGQLGLSRAYVDLLVIGHVEFAILQHQDLSRIIPEIDVFDLPFLIRDRDHFRKASQGSVRHWLDQAFAARGLSLFGVLDGSFRFVGSTRNLDSVFALEGTTIRSLHRNSTELFATMGAAPVRMSFGELPTALQVGIVDAYETTLEGVLLGRLDEVSQQMFLTRHTYAPLFLVGSAQLDDLSSEHRAVLESAARVAESFSFELGEELENEALNRIGDMGVEVRDLSEKDLEWMIGAGRHIYDEYAYNQDDGAKVIEFFLSQ